MEGEVGIFLFCWNIVTGNSIPEQAQKDTKIWMSFFLHCFATNDNPLWDIFHKILMKQCLNLETNCLLIATDGIVDHESNFPKWICGKKFPRNNY